MTIVTVDVKIDLSEVSTRHIRREAVARGLLTANEDDISTPRGFSVSADVDLDDIDDDDIAKEYGDRELGSGSPQLIDEIDTIKSLLRRRQSTATADAIVRLERLLGVDVSGLLVPAWR